MINEYCGSLRDTFNELVYYGILDERDAQCFRVESSLEVASYMLAAASILLALLNAFVNSAVGQFFRDKEVEGSGEDHFSVTECETGDEDAKVSQLQPAPTLFTDKFRWLLCREDAAMDRRVSTLEHLSDESGCKSNIYLNEEDKGQFDLALVSTKSTELQGEDDADPDSI